MADFKSDVVVIGAGAAGLAAASRLRQFGLTVRIIEARDRVGGRILTLRPQDCAWPVELGAAYIHGRPPELWDIVNRVQMRVFEPSADYFRFSGGKLFQDDSYYPRLDEMLIFIGEESAKAAKDESFSQFCQRLLSSSSDDDDELRQSLSTVQSYVEGYCAADPDLIGLSFLAQDLEAYNEIGDQNFCFLDGYDQIIDFLGKQSIEASELLHLNTVAKKIIWEKGKVSLTTNTILPQSGELGSVQQTSLQHNIFFAEQVIVTLPVGVLKAAVSQPAALSFDPELDKLDALKGIETSHVRRLTLVFSEKFWQSRSGSDGSGLFPSGLISCQDCPIPIWFAPSIETPYLVGWAGGRKALALLDNPLELEHIALLTISKIFEIPIDSLKKMLTGFYAHDWSNDPFSLGAYSYQSVGAQESLHLLGEPTEDTVYLAGEAINSSPFSGTVHGAIRSGYHAADQILSVRRLL